MSSWNTILTEAIALRHQLHRQPELTWNERQTAERIRCALDSLDIPWRACAKYGTVATLAENTSGRHIALRADMDALPITEQTNLEYQSEVDGCMHACGHDGHSAALWAMASWLKLHENTLPGPVSLIFQPAEEGGHGAREMIADGALDGIDCIYGWHNWPAIPLGQAVCPDGTVMCGNGTFKVTVTGKGGHASQPEACRDPVIAAAAITLNLQQIISRRLAPQSAAVVSVSSIVAPSAPTVTPEKALLEGSIRIAHPDLREQINDLIQQICYDTASTYGVQAAVEIIPRYEATINHTEPALAFRQALGQTLGAKWCAQVATPIMASEDFSYYLNAIPGAFALIGIEENGEFCAPCHSPHYRFNDRVLPHVVRALCRLVGAPLP
tara:strand:+ start:1089 stop:2240 length:1152 start_codon:yes stop_codon:yes gene_type:complete